MVEWSFEDFLDHHDLWNNTLQRSVDNHVFLTWEWLSSWWKNFGSKKKFLLISVIDDGRILAAAPLMISRCPALGLKVEFIGSPESDYHSFLLSERHKGSVDMILRHLVEIEPNWNVLDLNCVSRSSETAKLLRSMSSDSIRFRVKEVGGCAYVPLPEDFQEYLRAVKSSFMRKLKRLEKRLNENHRVQIKILDENEVTNDAINAFFELHQKRMRSKNLRGIFSDQKVRDFHIDVARSFAKKGWLVLAFLMLDDVPVAAQYDFKYCNKIYGYQSGFDPLYSKYSVASILRLRLIEHFIGIGLIEYDFMRGYEIEPYKRRWGTLRRENLRMITARKKIIYDMYWCMDLLKMLHTQSPRVRNVWQLLQRISDPNCR